MEGVVIFTADNEKISGPDEVGNTGVNFSQGHGNSAIIGTHNQ